MFLSEKRSQSTCVYRRLAGIVRLRQFLQPLRKLKDVDTKERTSLQENQELCKIIFFFYFLTGM